MAFAQSFLVGVATLLLAAVVVIVPVIMIIITSWLICSRQNTSARIYFVFEPHYSSFKATIHVKTFQLNHITFPSSV